MNKDKIMARLESEEGVKLVPYYDSLGNDSYGIGHLAKKPITLIAARQILSDDVDEAIQDIHVNLSWVFLMSDNRQTALVDMVFQLGINGVMQFTNMLSAMQKMDFETAYQQALNSDWARQTPSRAKGVALLILNG